MKNLKMKMLNQLEEDMLEALEAIRVQAKVSGWYYKWSDWIDELIDDLSRLKKEGKRLFAEGKHNRQRTFEEHRRNKE